MKPRFAGVIKGILGRICRFDAAGEHVPHHAAGEKFGGPLGASLGLGASEMGTRCGHGWASSGAGRGPRSLGFQRNDGAAVNYITGAVRVLAYKTLTPLTLMR